MKIKIPYRDTCFLLSLHLLIFCFFSFSLLLLLLLLDLDGYFKQVCHPITCGAVAVNQCSQFLVCGYTQTAHTARTDRFRFDFVKDKMSKFQQYDMNYRLILSMLP